MSQYLPAVHVDYSDPTPPMEEIQPMFEAVDRFNDKLRAEGVWVFAGGLLPLESATTMDATGATPIITDGPFAETKEHLGGFWIIEAADLDEALRWAAEGSAACRGKVEVRPFESKPA